ncbi:MAG: large subunit ribosomal protein [Gaiellaceae bacterium]|nr:large subunit ribosomal protein [Gaiellaceae bacterium]
MEVVLKSDVDKLGLRGEVVNVTRGYARNFLLPRGLAEVATPALVKELEKRDAQRARHEAKSVDEARSIATRLEALELRSDLPCLLDAGRLVPRELRLALLELLDEGGRRLLRQLAREQVVAGIAARDVDDLAAQAEVVDVPLEDHFDRHVFLLLADVRKQGELARALHRDGDLALVAPARAADAARTDLSLLRHVAPELVDVLVVDLVDLALAEEAGLAAPGPAGRGALPAPSLLAIAV